MPIDAPVYAVTVGSKRDRCTSWFGLERRRGEGDEIRSEDVRTGVRVRVRSDRTGDFAGRDGLIMQTYGDPEYRAAEVRFEGGGSGLFWYYQMEKDQKA